MFFEKNFSSSFGSDSPTSNDSPATTKPHVRRLERAGRCCGFPIGNYTLAVLLASCVLMGAVAGCGSNYTVTAAGIGAFEASSDAVEFGNVQVGQTANSSLTLINQGTTAVSVSDLSISGSQFAIASPSSLPVTVAPNSTYSVNLQFKPKTNGDSTGQLTVSSSSQKSPSLKIKLHGNGAAAVSGSTVLSSLSCGQSSAIGSGVDECTVTLSSAATGSGVVVNLASNNSAVTVPGSVTVAAGATSAGFAATISAVTAAQTATLTATAAGATQTYGISLGAFVPGLKLSTTSLNFGGVTVNTASAGQTVTLTSSGTAPVTINSAGLTGSGFSESGMKSPMTLNPGQTASLTVVFDPTVAGTSNGAISISDNASPGTATISLNGTGMSGAGSLSGLSCTTNSFTGSGSDVCTVTLSGAATGSGVVVSLGSNKSAITVPGSVTVPAGATSAGFTATVSAVTTAQTATLTATAGGATQTYGISLGAFVPGLKLSTSSLNFGGVTVNTSSTQLSVTLTSSGTAPLTINSAGWSGAGFNVSGATFPATLNPGQTATLTVVFDPTVTGTAAGAITISDNASPSTATISLSGIGQSAPGVLSALSCSQNSITGSGNDACTVTLTAAAGTSGQAVSLSSDNSAVTVPGVVTVPAGSTTVGFTAAVSAVTTAQTATVTASAGGVTKTYGIRLGAAVPALSVSTSRLNFGDVLVNTASTRSITLTSSGTAALTITGGSASGSGFGISGVGFPVTLNPGQSATLTVSFTPTASGAAAGSITLNDNASPSTATVNLSGIGQSAPGVLSGVTCSQNSIAGAGSDACTVSLSTVAGTGGLSVSLASDNNALSVPGSVMVPAGSSSAGFTAAASAVTTAQTATITASAGGVTKTYAINLGTATPALGLSASSVPFGNVNLNSPATQPVTLTSTGTAPVIVSAGSVSGAGFSISGINYPLTLNPGQSATLYIQFDPTSAGAATGTVTLTSNASPSTATIALSGTGGTVAYEVQLTWNAPTNSTDPVAGYNIYRAAGDGSSYELLNSSVNPVTTYSDTAVQNGTSYTYYVVSVDANGNQSAPSNTFSASIP